MSGLVEPFVLVSGIEVAGQVHVTGALRPATLADEYAAIAMVPPPDDVASAAQRIAYQVQLDDATILCQVVHLGDLNPAPLPTTLLAALDADDMAVLREAAATLKKKWRASKNALRATGEPSLSSSEPVTT